jgi:hypothetical protein
MPLEFQQDGLEKLARRSRRLGDVDDGRRPRILTASEKAKRSERVSGALGKHGWH